MQLKQLSLATLIGAVSAQSLTEALSGNENLSQLAELIGSLPQEVQTALGSASNVTLLAPSNSALETLLGSPAGEALAGDVDLLTGVLQYHVINGTFEAAQIPEDLTFVPTLLTNEEYSLVTGGQVVGVQREGESVTIFSGAGSNTTVSTADVAFDGGVIHIIDDVLEVPVAVSETAVAAGLTAVAGALETLELTETVDSLPDITVFAPNNAAFEAIAGAIANLTTDDLTGILSYHVVNGTVAYSNLLTDGMTVPALAGGDITVKITDGDVFVNNAKVIMPNVLVKNGVVHVIDNVLSPNATGTDQGPIVPSATGTEIPFTTAAPSPTSGGNGGEESADATTSGAMETQTDAATMPTGAVGLVALFGAAAIAANL